ncbi:MAG: diversity-generating retroelement protein Avd [Deltaproteobacteria bacterium]|nr:diversity-generating retroelement protein Avd [Deltaproteobacteria bacterium]
MEIRDNFRSAELELPVFAKWFDFVKWLLPFTDKLPKKIRFSITNRINNLALDIVEDLIEARYSRSKSQTLRSANLRLEKLRILMRLCVEQELMPHKTYQHAVKAINETGSMLGGWMKQQEAKA